MYEAMLMTREQGRTFVRKARMGFFKSLEAAQKVAKEKAAFGDVPFVQLQGRCVWSPLTERL